MQNRSSQVLLATGKLCAKSELSEGMKLLNEQSRPQVLKHLEQRTVPAFEVRPMKCEPFIMGYDQKLIATSVHNTGYLLLKVSDFVKQSHRFRASFRLVHTDLQFSRRKALPIAPYFLGLLLGDGCFRGGQPFLTTPDPEIIYTIYDVAEANHWPLRVDQTPTSLSNDYFFKKSLNGSLKQHLQDLGLWGMKSKDKFIPDTYLYASHQDRWALLAGLLDADGYLQGLSYEIKTASFQLADQMAFLARSLGLGVAEKEYHIKGKRYARLYIHGDFAELPIQINRKKTWGSLRQRNPRKVPFTVHPAGIRDVFYLGGVDTYLTGDLTVRKGDDL